MTPALQECLGRGLLTDPRGDSAEKPLDGSRLDVRGSNHGPIWWQKSLRLVAPCSPGAPIEQPGSLSQERNVHVERIYVRSGIFVSKSSNS